MEELNMELTVMNKRRYDELVGKITNLELEIARAHTQLEAIQNSNNQLAEIAFDESKFTDMLLERCEETAREAAKDAIDLDDIATDVVDRMDVSEDVERIVKNLECITKDDLNDKIDDCVAEYIRDNNILDSDEVESTVETYIRHNCDFVESDVTDELRSDLDELRDEMDTLKETIVLEVLQLIANKLTAKENDNANNSRDNKLHISGTNTTSQGASMLNAPAGQ
jgi:hypothetical protein